jgi:hypothetical protein
LSRQWHGDGAKKADEYDCQATQYENPGSFLPGNSLNRHFFSNPFSWLVCSSHLARVVSCVGRALSSLPISNVPFLSPHAHFQVQKVSGKKMWEASSHIFKLFECAIWRLFNGSVSVLSG